MNTNKILYNEMIISRDSNMSEIIDNTFSSEDELIKYFKTDLARQIENHKNKNAPYSALNLNISNYEINFEFNFKNILMGLGITEDENRNLRCPYIIEFSDCTFSQYTNFKNIIFNKNIFFNNCNFDYVLDFTDVVFTKNVVFKKTGVKGNMLFESVKFEIFENPEDENNKRLFENVNFKEITCCNSYMRNITFEKCNFEELNVYKLGPDINNFLYPTEWDTVNFTHCKFNKLLLGKSIIRDCLFNEFTIIEEADFYKHPFRTNMNNLATTRTIIDNTKFIKVDFLKEGDFKTVIFENQVEFVDIKFKQKISFDNIIMNTEKSYLVFRDINKDENNTIAITNTVINGRIDFNNVSISHLDLSNTVVIGNGVISTDNLNVEKYHSWKTALFLKHEAIKISNTIESLKYQAEEKKLYTKHLHDNKTWSNLLDRFSLLLGEIVNNHGHSWGRAILFTLWVWVFSFTIFSLPNYFFTPIFIGEVLLVAMSYLLCEKSKLSKQTLLYVFYLVSLGILFYIGRETINWGDYLEGLIEYFVPTKYDTLITYVEGISNRGNLLTICGIGVYFIGKIFIPYGVYEVIKAFRKYR